MTGDSSVIDPSAAENVQYNCKVVICASLPVICMGAPETVDRDQSFVWELVGRRAGFLDELLTS